LEGEEQKSSEWRKSMKRSIELMAVAAVVLLFGFATSAPAQILPPVRVTPPTSQPTRNFGVGTVVHPQSGIANPGDTGVRAHTNVEVFMPAAGRPEPYELPPFLGYAYETPASLACLYNLVTRAPGSSCNPNVVISNPTGGSQSIVIVDAYDDPWAGPDLAYFSADFGLPFKPGQLQVVYASGVQPPIDITGGWELEESLDIEYAHAMAPNATIYLVEAASNSFSDLFLAVNVASNLVQCGNTTYPYTCSGSPTGKGEVSMSWGGGEFSTETTADGNFLATGVVYFAASGDNPGVSYPCASVNVVCVGGTTTARNPNGPFLYEISWDSGGGGVSAYEPFPSYQNGVANIGETKNRGVPDVSSDANPYTGVWVWDSNYFEELGGGWFIVGGTSVATPTWAGIVNSNGNFFATSSAELTSLYNNRFNSSVFNDITFGACGPYAGLLTTSGWDFCTGIGSPNSKANK